MKKYLFVFCASFPFITFSQVGINTNEPQVSLDVQADATTTTVADGIIAPRLTAEQLKAKDNIYQTAQTGAIVYVTQSLSSSPTPKTIKVKDPGYYYFDGELWQGLERSQPSKDWFYMPSFNLDMSSRGQKSVNLYENYLDQFTKRSPQFFSSESNTSIVSNVDAPLFEANELEYIVTFYDERYLTIDGITAAGVMTYTVNDTNPPVNTFINIVLKPLN